MSINTMTDPSTPPHPTQPTVMRSSSYAAALRGGPSAPTSRSRSPPTMNVVAPRLAGPLTLQSVMEECSETLLEWRAVARAARKLNAHHGGVADGAIGAPCRPFGERRPDSGSSLAGPD